MGRIGLTIQPDYIDYGQLQQLVESSDLVVHLCDILDSLRHGAVC